MYIYIYVYVSIYIYVYVYIYICTWLYIYNTQIHVINEHCALFVSEVGWTGWRKKTSTASRCFETSHDTDGCPGWISTKLTETWMARIQSANPHPLRFDSLDSLEVLNRNTVDFQIWLLYIYMCIYMGGKSSTTTIFSWKIFRFSKSQLGSRNLPSFLEPFVTKIYWLCPWLNHHMNTRQSVHIFL